jgi:hypothetical protein
MYLIIIYYMLYNVVWTKLRTVYYVVLSQTLNKKKVTINFLYFIVNYLHSLISNVFHKNLLIMSNAFMLQRNLLGFDKHTDKLANFEDFAILSSFYLTNQYNNNSIADSQYTVNTNNYIQTLY